MDWLEPRISLSSVTSLITWNSRAAGKVASSCTVSLTRKADFNAERPVCSLSTAAASSVAPSGAAAGAVFRLLFFFLCGGDSETPAPGSTTASSRITAGLMSGSGVSASTRASLSNRSTSSPWSRASITSVVMGREPFRTRSRTLSMAWPTSAMWPYPNMPDEPLSVWAARKISWRRSGSSPCCSSLRIESSRSWSCSSASSRKTLRSSGVMSEASSTAWSWSS